MAIINIPITNTPQKRKSILKLSHSLAKNIKLLATGNVAAHFITITFATIITRIYGPENYGILNIYISIGTILISIAGLTYPVAIVLPKNRRKAAHLLYLSILSSAALSIILIIIFFFLGNYLLTVTGNETLNSYKYYLPIYIVLHTITNCCTQLLIRKKKFKKISTINVKFSLVQNAAKTGLGLISNTAQSLIISHTAGVFFNCLMHIKTLRAEKLPKFNKKLLVSVGREYKDFPILRCPQVLLNAVSNSLPFFLLTYLFSSNETGYFGLASSMLALPTALLGNAITQALYPQANELHIEGKKLGRLITHTMAVMAATALPVFIIVAIWGPNLFQLIFGDQWSTAGKYAQWLTLLIGLNYLNKPVVTCIPILKIQKEFLLFEIISTILKIITIILSAEIWKNDIIVIANFSIIGALVYLPLIAYVVSKAYKEPK